MKKDTKKLLVGAGVVATVGAAAVVVSHGITKYLVNAALNREEPKSMTKLKKRLTATQQDNETVEKVLADAQKLEAQVDETIVIESSDGQLLVGHWCGCEDPQRIILAMHGWRSSWSNDFGAIADFWHDNHCCVLYVEQRGQNESSGEVMGFGVLERYDCLEWIRWIDEHNVNQLPLYLCGISMGATTALMASGLGLPECVHGIMADCGFTSIHNIWKHTVKNNLHLPYDLWWRDAKAMCEKRTEAGSYTHSTVDALETNTTPVLFIHGEDDQFVPVTMTHENYEACTAPKYLLLVPGAAHGMSYLVDKIKYEETVLQFWREFDVKAPQPIQSDQSSM